MKILIKHCESTFSLLHFIYFILFVFFIVKREILGKHLTLQAETDLPTSTMTNFGQQQEEMKLSQKKGYFFFFSEKIPN